MADHAHDTEEEEAKLEPKSETADVGPCKVKLTIEVSADKVKHEIEHKYDDLNDQMVLPGFRRGHAPRHILERKFGKQIHDEVKFNLLARSFDEVREERKLEPLGEPDLDAESIPLKEGEPFKYEVVIEVKPQLNLKPWTGVPVKKVQAAVSDADLELQLRELAESRAEWRPVDEAARAGDQIVADFELSVDGKASSKHENVAVELTSDISFSGVPLPTFHEKAVGKKAGDRAEHAFKLPEGKDAVLACTIKSVKRRELPPIDEAFAKSFDADSVDELKDIWRRKLAREREDQAQHEMADQVVKAILKDNPFPLPEGLVAAGTADAVAREQARLVMGGMDTHKAEEEAKKTADATRETIVEAMRERFVLEHIGNKEKIYVTEEQVEERVQRIAQGSGKWPQEVRTHLEENDLMTPLRRNMREDAVREFLLSKAKIEE